MTVAEVEAFLRTAQARMYFARFKCTVTIDGVTWGPSFAQGTPYRLASAGRRVR
jgi:hypothetical protein